MKTRTKFNKTFIGKRAGAEKEACDYWMGHKTQYEGAYGPFGDEQSIREYYVKYAEEAVEPKGIPPDVESALDEQKTTVKVLTQRVTELESDKSELEERLRKGEGTRLKMEKRIGELEQAVQRGDPDVDKLVEVLRTLIQTPLGYTGPQDEDWLERAYVKAEKILEELAKRRLKKRRREN